MTINFLWNTSPRLHPACGTQRPQWHQPWLRPTPSIKGRGLENYLGKATRQYAISAILHHHHSAQPDLVQAPWYQQTEVHCWHCLGKSTWHRAVANPQLLKYTYIVDRVLQLLTNMRILYTFYSNQMERCKTLHGMPLYASVHEVSLR